MPKTHTPVRRPRLWLLIGAILSALSIAVLWPLQQVGRVCAAIYPAPPGCGASEPGWVPLLAIGLILAAFAAMVVIYFTVQRPRTPFVVLAAVILFVAVLAAAIVGLSQTGVWDPYQPPVIVN